jgi:hypothetical protein
MLTSPIQVSVKIYVDETAEFIIPALAKVPDVGKVTQDVRKRVVLNLRSVRRNVFANSIPSVKAASK